MHDSYQAMNCNKHRGKSLSTVQQHSGYDVTIIIVGRVFSETLAY